MSDDTTTSDSVDAAANEAQVVDAETNTEADNQDEDTSQTSETDESGSDEDNSEDAELKDWAAKKNLPLDDPVKIAKMYREAERQLGKQGQKRGQLKNAVTSANETVGADDFQALKNEVEALNFWVNHPGAREIYEELMVDILDEKPYLGSDLEAVLDIAKGRTAGKGLLEATQAGKREARALAEQTGRAAPPRTSANTGKPSAQRITAENVDALMGQHMGDTKWYNAHIDEINHALAS